MPSSGVQTCARSEEHTSELQSHSHLVCRLLLEKKKIKKMPTNNHTFLITRHTNKPQYMMFLSCFYYCFCCFGCSSLFFFFVCFFFFFLNNRAPPKFYPLPLPAPFPI